MMDRFPVSQWPEPIVRVQAISESGLLQIPPTYIKPRSQRPTPLELVDAHPSSNTTVPLVDLDGLKDDSRRPATLREMSKACRELGFFEICNHGVDHQLMERMRELWRGFFDLPSAEKEAYANNPATYEGYGSRLGVDKGAVLDWGDYFFLYLFPLNLRDANKWPSHAKNCREIIVEYGDQMSRLYLRLMKAMSINLGLREDFLIDASGGDVNASLRANFYPKCPQPELTLGLSPHSDPGCLTILLADEHVNGLQVRNGNRWVTVCPRPGSLIVNMGDQIQVITNAIYRSVEHRVVANSLKQRLSIAFFCNPKSDFSVGPAAELVTDDRPAMYKPMTFNEYRVFIRTKGACGKRQITSLTTEKR